MGIYIHIYMYKYIYICRYFLPCGHVQIVTCGGGKEL